jgi:hypothetical protein
LVRRRDVPGYSWKRYSLTPAGVDQARRLLVSAPKDAAHKVAAIKRRVTEASFNRLLQDVYSAYPEYAANSLFRS